MKIAGFEDDLRSYSQTKGYFQKWKYRVFCVSGVVHHFSVLLGEEEEDEKMLSMQNDTPPHMTLDFVFPLSALDGINEGDLVTVQGTLVAYTNFGGEALAEGRAGCSSWPHFIFAKCKITAVYDRNGNKKQ